MNAADAIFEAIGILTSAYLLGYPLYWVINKPVEYFQRKSHTWQQFNYEWDQQNGGQPLQLVNPFRRHKD